MLRILNKLRKVGIVTEPKPVATGEALDEVSERLREGVARRFRGSLAVREVDAGSCNGCELEIHALNNSLYDVERFGIHFVASPRHADLLLVTGPGAVHMETALLRTYEATPDPKLVIAVGDCAACGGEFGCSYASHGGIGQIVPVDAVIKGCPPTPQALMEGLLEALEKPR